jgi:hypothetical protein
MWLHKTGQQSVRGVAAFRILRRRALCVPEPLRAAPVRDGTNGSPSGRRRSWRSHTHPGPNERSTSRLSYGTTGSFATPDVKTFTRSGEDRPYVEAWNELRGVDDESVRLQLGVWPELFIGSRVAPLVVLAQNPACRSRQAY